MHDTHRPAMHSSVFTHTILLLPEGFNPPGISLPYLATGGIGIPQNPEIDMHPVQKIMIPTHRETRVSEYQPGRQASP